MFLVDNLLLGPGKAAMFVFKELARKAQADWLDDDSVKQELMELYALVEAGKISSQEFEGRECRLLARLEQIAKAKFNDKWGALEAQEPALLESTVVDVAPQPAPAFEPAPPLELPPAPAIVAAPVAPPVYEVPPVYNAPAPVHSVAPVYNAPPPPVYSAPSPVYSAPPPVYLPPPAAPAPPPVAAAAPGSSLSVTQVLESATRALAMLHLKVSAITSVSPGEDGWRVTAELVERRGVPDTSDLLGIYELRLDAAGNVVRYERTHIRRRCDLGRT